MPHCLLAALRDASNKFGAFLFVGRLLKSIRIPSEVEGDVQATLVGLDSKLLEADPQLVEIAAMIGLAANVGLGQGEGGARLGMLPMNTWDLISRACVVLKNETLRPWLPLDHHGQGLQSLSVNLLFQAAVFQQPKAEQAVPNRYFFGRT